MAPAVCPTPGRGSRVEGDQGYGAGVVRPSWSVWRTRAMAASASRGGRRHVGVGVVQERSDGGLGGVAGEERGDREAREARLRVGAAEQRAR